MEIGAQFYTLREHCQDLNGLEESLKKVAAIGYKTVQLSGVCAYEPAWIKEKLEESTSQAGFGSSSFSSIVFCEILLKK